jgi:capsular exopolysaccharide synthesis family protein
MSHAIETVNEPEFKYDPLDPPLMGDFLNLARVLRRRKLLVLLGLVIAIGLGTAACFIIPPAYESEARLIIVRKWPRAVPIPSADPQMAYLPESLSTHEALLTSPVIVERAIREADLTSLESLQSTEEDFNPAAAVKGGLEASRDAKNAVDPNSAILNVSYACKVEEDAPIVLEAVIESYRGFLAESHRQDSEKIAGLFAQWKEEVQKELLEKREAYMTLRESIPPELWKGEEGTNLAQQRLSGIRAEHLTHLLRATIARARLEVMKKAKQDGVSPQIVVELVDKWTTSDNEEEDSRYREQLSGLLLDEKGLLETYGPSHPLVKAAQERIRLARELHLGASDPGELGVLDSVEAYTQYLEQELQVSESLEQSLAKLAEEEHARAKETDEQSEDSADLRDDIARARELEKEIIARLQEVEILKDSGSVDAQVIAPPGEGELVIWRKPIVILGLAVFFGLALGGGFAALAEMTDRSYRNPEEIEHDLGSPVVGQVPPFRPSRSAIKAVRSGTTAVHPLLFAYHDPDSPATEAVRGTRAVLFLGARDSQCQVVQITSPGPADGRALVAANLAVSVAQSGKRTILIDADMREPVQHNAFGLQTDTGLSAVLADEAEIADAILPSGVPGLDILPSGHPPRNPGELLASPRFLELLDYVRDRFDVAIIDTAPVLAVSDPRVVAPLADGVLLVFRNSRNARPLIRRIQLLMNPLKVNLLGVILNQLEYDDTRLGDGRVKRPSSRARLEDTGKETEPQEAHEVPVGSP